MLDAVDLSFRALRRVVTKAALLTENKVEKLN